MERHQESRWEGRRKREEDELGARDLLAFSQLGLPPLNSWSVLRAFEATDQLAVESPRPTSGTTCGGRHLLKSCRPFRPASAPAPTPTVTMSSALRLARPRLAPTRLPHSSPLSTRPPAPQLDWPTYLALRRSQRRYGLLASIPTTFAGFTLGAGHFASIEAEPTDLIMGIEPIYA